MLQKGTFCSVKHGLLQPERAPFANRPSCAPYLSGALMPARAWSAVRLWMRRVGASLQCRFCSLEHCAAKVIFFAQERLSLSSRCACRSL